MDSEAPIGVFDSGVGGISVLEHLTKSFPSENFVYLGDTARLPYGTKSSQTVRMYAEQCLEHLHLRGVKSFVIACNTASSAYLEKAYKTKPVYNMIECGSLEIIQKTSGRKTLLLATKTTIQSGAYSNCLKNLNSSVELILLAAPLFVPLVEEGVLSGPLVEEVLRHTLKPVENLIAQKQLDVCLLACTHFPFLREEIEKYLGSGIEVTDSSSQLEKLLRQDKKNHIQSLRRSSSAGSLQFILTDSSDHFQKFILQRWPDRKIDFTHI
jgi:glutamate racemase